MQKMLHKTRITYQIIFRTAFWVWEAPIFGWK